MQKRSNTCIRLQFGNLSACFVDKDVTFWQRRLIMFSPIGVCLLHDMEKHICSCFWGACATFCDCDYFLFECQGKVDPTSKLPYEVTLTECKSIDWLQSKCLDILWVISINLKWYHRPEKAALLHYMSEKSFRYFWYRRFLQRLGEVTLQLLDAVASHTRTTAREIRRPFCSFDFTLTCFRSYPSLLCMGYTAWVSQEALQEMFYSAVSLIYPLCLARSLLSQQKMWGD